MARPKQTIEALLTEVKKMSSVANQRLRRIENKGIASSSLAYSWVKKQAYDDKSFMDYSRKGQPKFRTDTKNMTYEEVKELKRALSNFLSSKTSTIRGTKKKYDKAWKSYNESMAREGKEAVSFEEYTDIHDSAIFRKYMNRYGSQEARDVVDKKDNKSYEVMAMILEEDERLQLEGKYGLSVQERMKLIERDKDEEKENEE